MPANGIFAQVSRASKNIWTDQEWRGLCNTGRAKWLGWMTARAFVIMEQEKIRQWAEEGGRLDD